MEEARSKHTEAWDLIQDTINHAWVVASQVPDDKGSASAGFDTPKREAAAWRASEPNTANMDPDAELAEIRRQVAETEEKDRKESAARRKREEEDKKRREAERHVEEQRKRDEAEKRNREAAAAEQARQLELKRKQDEEEQRKKEAAAAEAKRQQDEAAAKEAEELRVRQHAEQRQKDDEEKVREADAEMKRQREAAEEKQREAKEAQERALQDARRLVEEEKRSRELSDSRRRAQEDAKIRLQRAQDTLKQHLAKATAVLPSTSAVEQARKAYTDALDTKTVLPARRNTEVKSISEAELDSLLADIAQCLKEGSGDCKVQQLREAVLNDSKVAQAAISNRIKTDGIDSLVKEAALVALERAGLLHNVAAGPALSVAALTGPNEAIAVRAADACRLLALILENGAL